MNRILTITANCLIDTTPKGWERTTPSPLIKGKYFYVWHDNHIVKHRFLGYCVNQFAFRIATLSEDIWSKP